MIRIAIVVGEPSGDLLAVRLMQGLKKILPNVYFYGAGGQKMKAEGFDSWGEMERYTFMGFYQLLWRYFPLLRWQKKIIHRLLKDPPDLFIGVDSSSFNLTIARKLKENGIKTIQYVSPKVWAWREERVYEIKKSVDKVLTLFPFEKDFFDSYDMPATFVGHPFADEISLHQDKNANRSKYHFTFDDRILVVMPGSRGSDLNFMGPLFIQTMLILKERMEHIKFVVPLISEELKIQFEKQLKRFAPSLKLSLVIGNTREVLSIADLVLVKSGTGTLETMLMKKPMVVAYKMGHLTAKYVKRTLKIRNISLPNILAGKKLVEEYLQENATPDVLAQACIQSISDEEGSKKIIKEFEELHVTLKKNNVDFVAKEIVRFLGKES